jgi:phage shock protein A
MANLLTATEQNRGNEMDKQIAEMIHAYSRAEGFFEAERMKRLARMTPEEAQAIFDDLCQAWEAVADRQAGLDRLEPLRIERLARHAAPLNGWRHERHCFEHAREYPVEPNLEGNLMKLIDRISLLVRANVGSLLGRSADGPTDRQRSVRNGERELARAREALAKAADHQKTLADQVAAADEQTQAWAQKAEVALQAGDEAQAREALAQQQKQERMAEELRARLERRLEETDRLESRLEMLEAELDEIRQQVVAGAAEQVQADSAPSPVKPEGRLAASPPAKKESTVSPDLEARKARLAKKDE